MLKKIFLLVIVSVFILFSFSCKTSSQVDDPGDPPAVGVFVGNIAQNFTEKDSKGNDFSLNNFQGKVILLNFSAMWCGPCRQEASQLMEIYNTYKERGFEIVQCIYQNEDGNPADQSDLSRWIGEFKLFFTVIFDIDYSTVNTYNFSFIPFNVIIDRDFIIRHRISSFEKNNIINLIESYL